VDFLEATTILGGLYLVYITGDTHGDISRFKDKKIKKLKKGDTLIICGDFGFLWDGSKKEQKVLKWLGKRKYHILFVEGCNENYDLLDQYEVSEWNGGKVQVISGNLMHLMRGEIYTIEDKTYFAFGGGDGAPSQDLQDHFASPGREQPTVRETSHGIDRLEEAQGKVDIMITHDAPIKITQSMDVEHDGVSFIQNYLDALRKTTSFSAWYFGKYHKDRVIPPYYHNVFMDIIPVEPPKK
jgi:predicted phosphodiesterase